MKVKRISLLVKGKSAFSDTTEIRERKIRRSVEAAIDKATEEKLLAEEKAIKALESMKDSTDSSFLTVCINNYLDAKYESEEWNKRVGWAKNLADLLDEEVEVEEMEEII